MFASPFVILCAYAFQTILCVSVCELDNRHISLHNMVLDTNFWFNRTSNKMCVCIFCVCVCVPYDSPLRPWKEICNADGKARVRDGPWPDGVPLKIRKKSSRFEKNTNSSPQKDIK